MPVRSIVNRMLPVPLVIVLSMLTTSCGVGEKERFYGVTEQDRLLGNSAMQGSAWSSPSAAAKAREVIVSNHPEWSADVQAAVRAGEAAIGMSRAQADIAWWGGNVIVREIRPVKYANRIRRERFLYDCAPNIAAHYFVDDTLIAVRLYDEAGHSIPMSLGPAGLGYTRPERTQPVQDRETLYKRTWLIYPEWREPMSRRPVASDIP